MTESPAERDLEPPTGSDADRLSLPDTDPGDDRGVSSGQDTRERGGPGEAPKGGEDTGGPDTQLAPDRD